MKKAFLATPILALVMFTTGCPNGTKTAATAVDTVAHALDAAQQAEQAGVTAGIVTPAEDQAFEAALVKTGQAGLQLDAAVLAQSTATTISAKASAFIASFNALNQSGLVIKNQGVQLGITTALTGAQVALTTIEGLVQ